jgi:hypothetical protein
MPVALAFDVVDQLRDLGFRGRIYFHVLGEPLLHPSVLDVVDYAAGAGMTPVLFTNGGALTGEVVKGVLSSRASELVISMQTINRRSFDLLRKTPFDWDTYLGRIQHALALAQDAPDGCGFRVSMGIKKTNAAHPEDRYFCEYESIDQIRDSIADIFGRVEGIDLTAVFAHLDARGPGGMPVARLTDRLSLSVKPMGNWRRVWGDERMTTGRCAFFGTELAVLSNGAVTFCHIDYDGRTAIGSVDEKPLAEIVGAPEVQEIAAAFIAGQAVARGCEHCRGVKTVGGRVD